MGNIKAIKKLKKIKTSYKFFRYLNLNTAVFIFNSYDISKQTKNNLLYTGQVLSKNDGLVKATGLYNVKLGELVYILNSKRDSIKSIRLLSGLVFNIAKTEVGIMFFANTKNLHIGQTLYRSKKRLKVPVGPSVLGRVIDSLGQALDGSKIFSSTWSFNERKGPGVITRGSVNEPLHTGILVIDCLFPIGRGQRELIIGNKQTGKTSIALTSIISQGLDSSLKHTKTFLYCVYVAIGQRKSSIAKIYSIFQKTKTLSYTTIVAATADDSANLQFLAPYAGCTVAEYFRDRGKDSLIIFDDLSKQAVCYRQACLLLERIPTRGAYPGDVFYLHSRLLERSAKLSPKYFGGSLTALPIIETVGGDITAYIPTNVISITDGQIYVDEDLFLNSIKPGVNIRLSVSRIGAKAQILPIKKVSAIFKNQLVAYDDVRRFEVFDDVSYDIKQLIWRGKRLLEQVKQGSIFPVNIESQLLLISLSTLGYFDKFSVLETKNFKEDICKTIKNNNKIIDINFFKNLDFLKWNKKIMLLFLKSVE